MCEVQTHLRLHHCPNRKTVNLQDSVPNVDGVPHLWTEKHPSHSGNTQVEEQQENTSERAGRNTGVFICSTGNVRTVPFQLTHSLTWTLAVPLTSLMTETDRPLFPLAAEGMEMRVTV